VEAASLPQLTGWRARLASHLGSGQVSRVVYGSIIGLALVLTMERHPPAVAAAAGSLLATAVAVALAELYSELIGAQTRAGLGGETEPVRTVVADVVAVGFGVGFPSVFFFAALVGLVEYDTAFFLAKWTGLGLIMAYGYVAGRLSGSSRGRAALQALAVGLVGAVLIGVKALLH
jgi:hypothetical protein